MENHGPQKTSSKQLKIVFLKQLDNGEMSQKPFHAYGLSKTHTKNNNPADQMPNADYVVVCPNHTNCKIPFCKIHFTLWKCLVLTITQLKVSAQELSVLDLLWTQLQDSAQLFCHTLHSPTLLKRLGDGNAG